MYLLPLFIGLVLLILALKRRKRILSALLLLYVLSIVAAIIVDRVPIIVNISDFVDFLFIHSLLIILIFAYGNHTSISLKLNKNLKAEHYAWAVIVLLGIVALLINSFIFVKSINLLLSDQITVQAYKNEGGAASYISAWVPSPILLISHLFSGIGYLALAFHFYYLLINFKRRSLVALLISFNVPLHSLQGLSRSGIVEFALIYSVILFWVYPQLETKIKNAVRIVFVSGGLLVLIPFYLITNIRFENSSYFYIDSSSVVKNVVLYSVFDYYGQWFYYSLESLKYFTAEKIWWGKSFSSLYYQIFSSLDIELTKYADIRKDVLGFYGTKFNGVSSTLVYDFGYSLALVFTMLFYFTIRRLGRRSSKGLTIPHLGLTITSIPMVALFFGNNAFSSITLNMGFIYAMILYGAYKIRWRL